MEEAMEDSAACSTAGLASPASGEPSEDACFRGLSSTSASYDTDFRLAGLNVLSLAGWLQFYYLFMSTLLHIPRTAQARLEGNLIIPADHQPRSAN